ncbi:MAG TPA: 6-carboxytetrahydropterin synthase QueD [Deltaproteobacteria bacterium]|nr:6-carboxytetrahydropterin synthase QueD [Deltaproteobacteria bacterium]
MYQLTIESTFAAAHNLRGYDGACERLHGHNWRVELKVAAETLNPIGIAVDFKTLKTETDRLLDRLDHMYLNEIPPFDRENPSSENLARFIYEELSRVLNDGNVKVTSVKVWESERAAAEYFE